MVIRAIYSKFRLIDGSRRENALILQNLVGRNMGDNVSGAERILWQDDVRVVDVVTNEYGISVVEAVIETRHAGVFPHRVGRNQVHFVADAVEMFLANGIRVQYRFQHRRLRQYLRSKGFDLTITALKCGHSFLTTSGNVSEHSTGDAVDIAVIDGTPVTGNQGPGTMTDELIHDVLSPYVLGETLSAADPYLHMLAAWYPGDLAALHGRLPKLAQHTELLRRRAATLKAEQAHTDG